MIGMSGTSGAGDGSRDDRYRIVLGATGAALFEWDDGLWKPEGLGANETLTPVGGGDRYAWQERYRAFIEVKILAPTADPADPAGTYVVVESYYLICRGCESAPALMTMGLMTIPAPLMILVPVMIPALTMMVTAAMLMTAMIWVVTMMTSARVIRATMC